MRRLLIDIKTCGLTLSQAMEVIDRYMAAYPEEDVFMDGDLYAIIADDHRRETA